jgi:hypothetical protein
MNSIKIELELPEFEKELNISVILRKDGEIVSTFSSPQPDIALKEKPVVKEEKPKDPPKPKKKAGGNMMDLEL